MASEEQVTLIEMTARSKSQPTWNMLLSDFANMLKAFIGANYLTIAYAFSQSGLVAGVAFLLVIASVTDHCCHLIVKCKYHAIDDVIRRAQLQHTHIDDDDESEENEDEPGGEIHKICRHMIRNITYGDVGKIAFGGKGLFVVNLCVLLTQFAFCVNYFIFVGNTLYSLFPWSNTTLNDRGGGDNTSESSLAPAIIFPTSPTIAPNVTSNTTSMIDLHNGTTIMNNTQAIVSEAWTTASTYLFDNISTISPQAHVPESNFSRYIKVATAPDLRLLVLTPFPIFVVFAFMRNVRHLGFVSVAANVSIFIGCVVTMIYLMIDFVPSETWVMYRWSTLPLFFGMVTSAYEGIGTIIPIESSMEGNRHNFSQFLHGAVAILAVILLLFGIMGYLRYGEETAQMLNNNMPNESVVGILINICLCVGVILTFPLQLFPVIELVEIYLFGDGRICGPKKKRALINNDESIDDDDDGFDENEDDISEGMNSLKSDQDLLIPKENGGGMHGGHGAVGTAISSEVLAWKRNVVRIIIVIAAGGLAVLLRNLYAYVSAFIGAIGSSLLAYILPCSFHLKLGRHKSSRLVQAKDWTIIVFGTIASIVSLYTTISEVVKDF